MKRTLMAIAAVAAILVGTDHARAVTVTVEPGAWNGYVNVFELPANGGGYVFGSSWLPADLTATFAGPVLTLGPNTIGDPDGFWYQGGGKPGAPGNKTIEANMYIEDSGALVGQTVTFTGRVLANTLTGAHNAVAFIKDFAPDYSSNTTVTAPLGPGPFSLSLATDPAAGRHVQYGFALTGPNVWITDVAPFGNVQVTTIPEPASVVLVGAAVAGLMTLRRRAR